MLEPGVHEDGGAADHNRANSERFCVGQPRDEVETVSSPTTTQACWKMSRMQHAMAVIKQGAMIAWPQPQRQAWSRCRRVLGHRELRPRCNRLHVLVWPRHGDFALHELANYASHRQRSSPREQTGDRLVVIGSRPPRLLRSPLGLLGSHAQKSEKANLLLLSRPGWPCFGV